MSSDDPTRRLPPTAPVTYADAEELLFREEVRDRLRSLKTTVVLLAVLAVVALGVAIWALLSSQDSSETQGASASRVTALEDQVDELSDDVKNAASKDDLQQLSRREQELADKVDDLDKRATQTSDGPRHGHAGRRQRSSRTWRICSSAWTRSSRATPRRRRSMTRFSHEHS